MTSISSEVVKAFYDAVIRRDANEIARIVSDSFNHDAAIVWPEGLPHGGRLDGARRIGKVFAGMAKSEEPVGPEHLEVVTVIDGGDVVAAELRFAWRAPGFTESVPSGAFEKWTFEGGKVAEIRAYYWDTAACQEHFVRVQNQASA